MKFDPSPKGVPLDDLQRLLSATTLKISRDVESLTAEHETAVTKLKVVSAAPPEVGETRIQAMVQIRTALSIDFPKTLLTPKFLMALNRFAVLGALTLERDQCFVGSQLTVFKGQERAWKVYLPFLLFAVIAGCDSHVGAVQAVFGIKETREASRGGA